MSHCRSEAGGAAALLASGWATEAGAPFMSPWMSERAESSTHGSRWCGAGIMWMRECPLHTAERCRGAGIVWIREQCLPTRQPLMWGWYHVNERVSFTHGRPLSGGWYRVNKRAVPNTAAADEGLVSCEWVRSQVIVLCTIGAGGLYA